MHVAPGEGLEGTKIGVALCVGRRVAGLHFASGESLEDFASGKVFDWGLCSLQSCLKGCRLACCIGSRFGRLDFPERRVASLHFAPGEALEGTKAGVALCVGRRVASLHFASG